ncbi:MAG: tetratricopeptide repeat protein [Sulfuriferula sp.]
MNNEKNLPIVQESKALTVSGQQVSLVSRGLGVLKSIASDSQDDNNAARQWELGCEYLKGTAAARDYERAFYWFCNAAEQGHAEAQFALGALYAAGDGVKQSDALAVQWYRKAAEQGHAWAKRNLALRLASGKSVVQNDK